MKLQTFISRITLFLCSIFCTLIIFSSCTIETKFTLDGTDIADLEVYIVQYSTPIETAPEMRGIVKNAIFKQEWIPELSHPGYVFNGWYWNDTKIDCDYKIQENMKLTASWTLENPEKMIICLPVNSPETVVSSKGSVYYSLQNQKVSPYKLGAYDITYKLWWEVKTWALDNGYVFCHQGQDGDSSSTEGLEPSRNGEYPVTGICFWDIVIWCNAYSEKSNLTPVYYSDGSYRNIYKSSSNSSKVTGIYIKSDEENNVNTTLCTANGYRLPSGAEWIWGALGGDPEKDEWMYKYSGSNDPDEVAVYNVSRMAVVGSKKPNSLGLCDMTGNARETLFCFKNDTPDCYRVGGSYGIDDASLITLNCITWSGSDNPKNSYPWVTFRVAQSIF